MEKRNDLAVQIKGPEMRRQTLHFDGFTGVFREVSDLVGSPKDLVRLIRDRIVSLVSRPGILRRAGTNKPQWIGSTLVHFNPVICVCEITMSYKLLVAQCLHCQLRLDFNDIAQRPIDSVEEPELGLSARFPSVTVGSTVETCAMPIAMKQTPGAKARAPERQVPWQEVPTHVNSESFEDTKHVLKE
ncbi:hypothetical protein B0H17DRAFT_1142597 [Mycena rosella]|uniref:Uncharacterized protein n=1 Tax=Mycena rosella TaxID=1033263 RepID=A0AAD7G8W3_MYCRO|nr:hypothetical protein B0H17DRAFT_1142597 [Mycena rosella]